MKFILLFCCLLFSNDGVLLIINDQKYNLHDFYALYPKNQWMRADSIKKDGFFNDFINRSLCVLEAKNLGLQNNPEIRVKIHTLSNQLLVNETYEQLVAAPLIDPMIINKARINAKYELLLHHILVGHSDSFLAQPPKRSKDEALLLSQTIKNDYFNGASFTDLAKKYSDDPGANSNQGRLGWVEWGLTAPEFQESAFGLKAGDVSSPVLTAFGYHIIYVENIRPSDYSFMSKDQYEHSIINLSKRSVRDQLRPAAIKYDSLKIINNNILFNEDIIHKISNAYNLVAESSGMTVNINVYELLQSLSGVGVVLVYNGYGYGPLWFANKIKDVPVSRHPSLKTYDNVITIFKNFVLQDIALKDGKMAKINTSFAYLQRQQEIIAGILYDAYLKHLINNVSLPDTLEIKKYYDKYKYVKYSSKESRLVHKLSTYSKTTADSLFNLIAAGRPFSSFHKLIHNDFKYKKSFLSKTSDLALFNAASLLEVGKISPVVFSSDGEFSIMQLIEKKDPIPHDFFSVYSRIESLLLKQKKDLNKKTSINNLLNKYTIHRYKNTLP